MNSWRDFVIAAFTDPDAIIAYIRLRWRRRKVRP